MFATLGTVTLDILATTGLGISDGWDFAEHALIEGKPKLQHVGDQLREVSLSFRFHRSFCEPELELLALRDLAATRKAALLQFGSGRIVGRFVVTSLREDPDWLLDDGRPMAINCSVGLKEYAGDAEVATPSRAVAGSPVARRAAPPTAAAGADPAAVPSSTIVRA